MQIRQHSFVQLGSCAPTEPASARPDLRIRRVAAAALVLALAVATLLSSGRLLALWERTRPSGGYAAAERALRWNPADLNARFALAEAYLLARDCERARPHVAALRALLPYHHAPREMERACEATHDRANQLQKCSAVARSGQ